MPMLPDASMRGGMCEVLAETPVTPVRVVRTTWRTSACPSGPIRSDAPLRNDGVTSAQFQLVDSLTPRHAPSDKLATLWPSSGSNTPLGASTPRYSSDKLATLWSSSGTNTPLGASTPRYSSIMIPSAAFFSRPEEDTPVGTPVATPCDAAKTTWRSIKCPNAPSRHQGTSSGRSTPSTASGILTPMVRLWPESGASTPNGGLNYFKSFSGHITPTGIFSRSLSAPSVYGFGLESGPRDFESQLQSALAQALLQDPTTDLDSEPGTPVSRRSSTANEARFSPQSSSPKPSLVRRTSVVSVDGSPSKRFSARRRSETWSGAGTIESEEKLSEEKLLPRRSSTQSSFAFRRSMTEGCFSIMETMEECNSPMRRQISEDL